MRDPIDLGREQEDALLEMLGEAFGPYLSIFPVAMALELLQGDTCFVTPDQISLALAQRFRPRHRLMITPDVLKDLLPPTAFQRTRFQPLYGRLGMLASLAQPGFGYFAYVPLSYMLEPRGDARLIVAVHGSSRNAREQRDAFACLAEAQGCFVLAPVFPIEMDQQVPDEAYKHIVGGSRRYDRILLDMIDEFAGQVGLSFSRIVFFGFSGGAQYCHRFFYAHPRRVDALALVAPGYTTLPRRDSDWWVGWRDFHEIFGHEPDVAEMTRTPVLILCGQDDTAPAEVYSRDELGLSQEAYARYGRNRVQRAARLHEELCALGICAQLSLLQGSGHSMSGAPQEAVDAFVLEQFARWDAATQPEVPVA